MARRILLNLAAALALTTTSINAQSTGTGTQGQGLHSLFVASGKLFFGTATDVNNVNDAPYQAILNNPNEFGMIVPENSQKWEAVQPTEAKFTFANADSLVTRAKAAGQQFRCHTLTWHSQLPPFISATAWTRATLTAALETHIANVMGHFKGSCYSWDVVNEALAEDGTFREDVFLQVLGTDYLAISFRAAAKADPATKLYYNDFNLETTKAKADGAVGIVQLLQKAGVRIDGVGFQAHFTVGGTPSQKSLVATLEKFTSLGMDVSWSELDIAHKNMSTATSASALSQQASDYVAAVGACLAVPKCVGITVWQFTDKYSWIPNTFPGMGDACLYTANYTKKPAYFAVASLLASAAGNSTKTIGGNTTALSSTPVSTSAAVTLSTAGPSGSATTVPVEGAATSPVRSGGSQAFASQFGALLWSLVAVAVFLL